MVYFQWPKDRREYYGMDDLKLLEDEIDTAMV